jgi:hypothetical protein
MNVRSPDQLTSVEPRAVRLIATPHDRQGVRGRAGVRKELQPYRQQGQRHEVVLSEQRQHGRVRQRRVDASRIEIGRIQYQTDRALRSREPSKRVERDLLAEPSERTPRYRQEADCRQE